MEVAAQVMDRDVVADVGAGHELDAFGGKLLEASVHEVLLEFEVGNAVAQQATDAVRLFEDGNIVSGAAQLLRGGEARPGPEPMMATRLRVGSCGGCGRIQPSWKPRSMMFFSISLMVTGGWLMPSTQAASQGAGQMRPVNSGKLLVACNWRTASRHRPR